MSSMIFAFASIVTHSLFRTDPKDMDINLASSYLDLSPLYGDSECTKYNHRRTLIIYLFQTRKRRIKFVIKRVVLACCSRIPFPKSGYCLRRQLRARFWFFSVVTITYAFLEPTSGTI